MDGPLVRGAFLCDQVIEGKDNANSYIRLIDQLGVATQLIGPQVPGAPPPALPADIPPGSVVQAWLVLLFNAAGARGRHSVSTQIRRPDGTSPGGMGPFDVTFDDRHTAGVNIHVRLAMQVEAEGSYTIHVFMDRHLGDGPQPIADVPFTVIYQRVVG